MCSSDLNDSKSRSKALKIAVGVSGVDSAALGGNDKSQIEVTGEIDAVKLATLLRKNFGNAELVSVSAIGEKKEEKKEEKKDEMKEVMYLPSYPMAYRYVYPEAPSQYQDPCSIM